MLNLLFLQRFLCSCEISASNNILVHCCHRLKQNKKHMAQAYNILRFIIIFFYLFEQRMNAKGKLKNRKGPNPAYYNQIVESI
jgi:hypothetical protein